MFADLRWGFLHARRQCAIRHVGCCRYCVIHVSSLHIFLICRDVWHCLLHVFIGFYLVGSRERQLAMFFFPLSGWLWNDLPSREAYSTKCSGMLILRLGHPSPRWKRMAVGSSCPGLRSCPGDRNSWSTAHRWGDRVTGVQGYHPKSCRSLPESKRSQLGQPSGGSTWQMVCDSW